MTARRRLFLPTLARHLTGEFLRAFALTMVAFVAIYILAEFFDRFDDFLRHDASASTIVRAFLYKIPSILLQTTPVAVLAGALAGLGLLARNNEFVALRSCGVSLWQIAVPLAIVAIGIGVATFLWGETVVPASARQWNQIWNQEVRKRTGPAGVFAGREVWFHGRAGFYNVNRIAPGRRKLYGLTIYQMRRDEFRPSRVIESKEAEWKDGAWVLSPDARTMRLGSDGVREEAGVPQGFVLPESLDDFRVVAVEPEEFSYSMLRRQIRSLRAKGVDASESWVDLHLKIATPAASLIMMLLAIPLVARGTRATSLPAAFGLGFAVGVTYFFVVGFARALGQANAFPPLLAAWTANGIFMLLAGYYFAAAD
ncbi:MAG TPA: LPS export ABC transporter permease LptG [Candidatus Eisenbacteria bacterium]|nr:LPS export ABC transporter permease LptG [Candidatus Eisenbacteria bacterium]